MTKRVPARVDIVENPEALARVERAAFVGIDPAKLIRFRINHQKPIEPHLEVQHRVLVAVIEPSSGMPGLPLINIGI